MLALALPLRCGSGRWRARLLLELRELLVSPLGPLIGCEHGEAKDDHEARADRKQPQQCSHCSLTIGRSTLRDEADKGSPVEAQQRRPVAAAPLTVPENARTELARLLRAEALVFGDFVLASGARASYYVDCRRALLAQPAFGLVGSLVAEVARQLGAEAVGGLTLGADPIACAAIAADPRLRAFLVRKEPKRHGLGKWIEGPPIAGVRCLVVEDVVTSGSSLVQAIERARAEGAELVGALAVLDRLAGGRERVVAALDGELPYLALTTIEDLDPERSP